MHVHCWQQLLSTEFHLPPADQDANTGQASVLRLQAHLFTFCPQIEAQEHPLLMCTPFTMSSLIGSVSTNSNMFVLVRRLRSRSTQC